MTLVVSSLETGLSVEEVVVREVKAAQVVEECDSLSVRVNLQRGGILHDIREELLGKFGIPALFKS